MRIKGSPDHRLFVAPTHLHEEFHFFILNLIFGFAIVELVNLFHGSVCKEWRTARNLGLRPKPARGVVSITSDAAVILSVFDDDDDNGVTE
jgi:hypothetical protein